MHYKYKYINGINILHMLYIYDNYYQYHVRLLILLYYIILYNSYIIFKIGQLKSVLESLVQSIKSSKIVKHDNYQINIFSKSINIKSINIKSTSFTSSLLALQDCCL